MPDISIVIPVFQAESCLNELYNRLESSLSLISENYEIIFIEDCGNDKSWEMIMNFSKINSRVKGIKFSRNFGQHYGITAGLDFCIGDWVVVMDCDLQDKPEDISRLYSKAQEGFDIVLAKKRNRVTPVYKRFLSWLFYKLFNFLSGLDYDKDVGNFRIASRKVILNFCDMREQLRFFGGLMTWMGFKTASVEVENDPRYEGYSSYTLKKLIKLALDAVIAFSDKPLRLSIQFGFLISLISFLYGSYIFFSALVFGTSLSGWSSLMVSVYFLGGIIITILGILGTYLGKVYDETKNRPLYIIDKKTFD